MEQGDLMGRNDKKLFLVRDAAGRSAVVLANDEHEASTDVAREAGEFTVRELRKFRCFFEVSSKGQATGTLVGDDAEEEFFTGYPANAIHREEPDKRTIDALLNAAVHSPATGATRVVARTVDKDGVRELLGSVQKVVADALSERFPVHGVASLAGRIGGQSAFIAFCVCDDRVARDVANSFREMADEAFVESGYKSPADNNPEVKVVPLIN